MVNLVDNETEYRLFNAVKKGMMGDLAAGQRDLLKEMESPNFVNSRSKGTFKVLTEEEIAERRGIY